MRVWQRGLMLMMLAFASSPGVADPAGDYETGIKAYAAGDVVGSMPPLRRAADAGHAGAQARLGYILDRSGFDAEAAAYFRKAAEQNNADGQYGLGTLYVSGEGVPKDVGEARRLLTLAAQQDHPQAINVMVEAYLHGGLGLDEASRKGPEALTWLTRAAEKGYLPAIDALALAYGSGQYGLTPDPERAAAWTAKAVELRGTSKEQSKRKKSRK